jgi:hypothetical protein
MGKRKTILLSLLLSLPVILFLLQQCFYHSPDLKPTGFTIDENILYMSYAHQYTEQENFSLFYSNPFDGKPGSPAIYFQPINLIFAALLKIGADPGFTLSIFGLLMSICCIYIGIKIIRHLLPAYENKSLIAVLFTWGGGLTAIAGLIGSLFLVEYRYNYWLDNIYLADTAHGWWALNWGRNLFIPLEAYYHFLFLLNIYLILKEKWILSLFTALFISISHPFTGTEYLLIINGWLFIELLFFKNKKISLWYWVGVIFITAVHFWYYLYYLNTFPEHRQLFAQYKARWTYSLLIAIPAYCLVTLLAVHNVYLNKPIKQLLNTSHQRLFLCWAIIAFLLSKHEWFIKPMQPVHFTRGYVWSGIFLFALPGLIWLIKYLQQSFFKKLLLLFLLFIFLSDNILWTTNLLLGKNNVEWEGHISSDTKEVLDFLESNTTNSDLITGNAILINYIANAYTPVNTWVSHPFNTPEIKKRRLVMKNFFTSGVKPMEWSTLRILIVVNKKSEPLKIHSSLVTNKLFENNTYLIFTP